MRAGSGQPLATAGRRAGQLRRTRRPAARPAAHPLARPQPAAVPVHGRRPRWSPPTGPPRRSSAPTSCPSAWSRESSAASISCGSWSPSAGRAGYEHPDQPHQRTEQPKEHREPSVRRHRHPRLRPPGHRRGAVGGDTRPLLHGDRGPQRVRQVHAPARPVADAQAQSGQGAARRAGHPVDAGEEGRPHPGPAPAVVDRARRDHRRRPGRPWPLPAPGHPAPVVHRGRAGRPGVHAADRGRRARRAVRRRAVRRTAAAGVDRDGPRPADPAAAPRRADHLPRHPAPDRRPRPVRRTPRGAGPHTGRGAARPQPRRPLRHAPHRAQGGQIIAEGAPNDIVTAELVEEVFGLRCQVIDDPETGTPLVVPAARKARVVAKEAS